MPLLDVVLPVHVKNPRSGLPLCWNPKLAVTTFEASWFEDDANCRYCIILLESW